MPEIIRTVAGAFFGTLGFGLLVRAPKRSWIPASLLGAFTFAVYWGLTKLGLSDAGSVFAASLTGSLLGLFCALRMKMIGTVFLMLSIISFVPGLGLYRTMQYLGAGETAPGADQGIRAMITIAMIALGQGTGSFLFRAFRPGGRKNRKPAAINKN